ncbi:MAG: hypothetical protein ACXADC_01905 [Candidatus Thorarchaeota archaeon]
MSQARVLMRTIELMAITGLIAGTAFIILAAFIPRRISLDLTWSTASLVLGLVLVIWALGTLLPGRISGPVDRKFITLLLSGMVLASIGANIIIFNLAFRIIFPSIWWVYSLVGVVLFICGLILGTYSWWHRASLDS